jgi:pyridinium-3,5-biscarboxylic acid mononucleotide sulfurtransferase
MGDLSALRATLQQFERVVVAFSGGADSSFLAWVANDTLGSERVRCVTALSPSLASFEHDDCARLAAEWRLNWTLVETTEMQNAAYRRNDADRCFWCKDALMDALEPIAQQCDAVVVLGVNLDDLGDHRPGQRAAADRGARFPLVDAGFTKSELRAASHSLGLSTWDKPAAACLASRLPYGTPVEIGVLASVEAAERGLRDLGFRDVRVRHYRDLARVEVPVADLDALLAAREKVVDAVKAAGYRYVTVDFEGLRSGNLNAALGRSMPHERR